MKSSDIAEKQTHQKIIYWNLRLDNRILTCISTGAKTNIQCLVDELKPSFKLLKIGTHSIKRESSNLAILKSVVLSDSTQNKVNSILTTEMSNYSIIHDIPFREASFPITESLIHEIRKIFIFRELIGVTVTSETSSLIYRRWNRGYALISVNERGLNPKSNKSVLSSKIHQKWFRHQSLDVTALEIYNLTSMDEVDEFARTIRDQWIKISYRLSPNLSWLNHHIYMRIKKILSLSIERSPVSTDHQSTIPDWLRNP